MSDRDWKSDPLTGELVITDDIVMVEDAVGDPASIRQDVEERLAYARGEWFIDPEDDSALPYFERILVHNPNLAAIRSLYEKTILATPGVKAIVTLGLQLDRQTRRLAVNFTVSTDLGAVTGSVGG